VKSILLQSWTGDAISFARCGFSQDILIWPAQEDTIISARKLDVKRF